MQWIVPVYRPRQSNGKSSIADADAAQAKRSIEVRDILIKAHDCSGCAIPAQIFPDGNDGNDGTDGVVRTEYPQGGELLLLESGHCPGASMDGAGANHFCLQ